MRRVKQIITRYVPEMFLVICAAGLWLLGKVKGKHAPHQTPP